MAYLWGLARCVSTKNRHVYHHWPTCRKRLMIINLFALNKRVNVVNSFITLQRNNSFFYLASVSVENFEKICE